MHIIGDGRPVLAEGKRVKMEYHLGSCSNEVPQFCTEG